MGVDQMIAHIKVEINKAKTAQAEMAQQMAELATFIYPQVPNFQWQDRGGDSKYLFLTFRKTEGGYGGPDGKKKIYIGNDPENILQAQNKAMNTINHKELNDTMRKLKWWINNAQEEIDDLHRKIEKMVNNSQDWTGIRPRQFIWDSDAPGCSDGKATN